MSFNEPSVCKCVCISVSVSVRLHRRSNVCNWQAGGNVLVFFFLRSCSGQVRVRSESPSSRPSAIIILERNKFILVGHVNLAWRRKTHLSSKVRLTFWYLSGIWTKEYFILMRDIFQCKLSVYLCNFPSERVAQFLSGVSVEEFFNKIIQSI